MIDQRLTDLVTSVYEAGYEFDDLRRVWERLQAASAVPQMFREKAQKLTDRRVKLLGGAAGSGTVIGCSRYHIYIGIGGGVHRMTPRGSSDTGYHLSYADANRIYYTLFKPELSRSEQIVLSSIPMNHAEVRLRDITALTGMPTSTALKAMSELCLRGLVRRTGRGLYALEGAGHERREAGCG